MERFIEIIGAGRIKKEKTAVRFIVTKFKDIDQRIIPLFKKMPVIGSKLLNFEDFCKAAEIIRCKQHLNIEGMKKLKNIKAGMNTGRKQ